MLPFQISAITLSPLFAVLCTVIFLLEKCPEHDVITAWKLLLYVKKSVTTHQ